MSHKVRGAPGAVGYWGRNIHGRIIADQTAEKVLALHIDKVLAMGMPYGLWMEVPGHLKMEDQPGGIKVCSCVSTVSRQPDRPCNMCYGIGRIPGYTKFGTVNYWASSIDNWVVNNVVVNKDIAPFHLALDPTATDGTAVFGPIAIDGTLKIGDWEYDVYAACRDSNTPIDGGSSGNASQVYAEWSTDGSTWSPMSGLKTSGPSSGDLYFRITFHRNSTSIKSPMFGIIRARFPKITDIRVVDGTPEVNEPIIRAIPTWDNEMVFKEARGNRLEQENARFWTLPLNFFDPSLEKNGYESRIREYAFVEQRYGADVGYRFPVVRSSYSETFGIFTRQEFDTRLSQGVRGENNGEVYNRVF